MKKIISIIISLLFVISAILPLTAVNAADNIFDLTPDGEIVFVPDFNGMAGVYEPGLLSGTPEVTVDPANSNTMTLQTTKDKSASYWGGFIETLPLSENTCYTIYYTVTRTGNHAIGVYADSVYGAYGYPDKIRLMNKGSSLTGHEYISFANVCNAPIDADPITGTIVQEYALEVNGVNSTTAIYIKDTNGQYTLVDQSVEGQIEYFMADVLGLFFYTYYAGHVVTVSDCYVVKGLSWGEVVYPETTEAPEPTKAPETEAPATEPATEAPVATEAPATQAPETTKAPEKSGGCGSMMSIGAVLAIIPVAALVIKKKRD